MCSNQLNQIGSIGFKIRKSRKDDLEDQLNLVADMKERSQEERKREIEKYRKIWQWRFEDNPNNPDREAQIWVIEYNGKVIGQLPAIPITLWYKGKDIRSSWVAAFAIDPNWRHRGLGTILVKKWYQSVDISLATRSTKAALSLYRKHGWISLGSLREMVRICGVNVGDRHIGSLWKWVARFLVYMYTQCIATYYRITSLSLPEYDFVEIKQFLDDVGNFATDACKGYRIIERRDKNYLNWRFVHCPRHKYVIYIAKKERIIQGYVVLLRDGSTGTISDILTKVDNEKARNFLVYKSIEYFKRLNMNKIRCLATNPNLRRTLKKLGFLPNMKTPGDNFAIRLNRKGLDRNVFGNLPSAPHPARAVALD